VARVSEGATLQSPHRTAKETELIAVGLSGDFELSWHPPNYLPGKPASLEAFGSILSRLDVRGVETDAMFSVRSYGEAFDHFHIRLPPDSELVPGSGVGYTLTLIDKPTGQAGAGRQRTVDVQLARRTVGPVEIRFSTKRSVDPVHGERGVELAGFEVSEAARQSGTIKVSVAGDWRILWGANSGVRQIDSPEAMRQKDVVAVYDYFALSSSLTARLVTRQKRINVEPDYLITVDSDQIRLDAKLHYTVRGGKITAVHLAMPDWQIDDVGPENVVAVDGVATETAGPLLTLPLSMPTVGQFAITLKAHRSLPPDAKTFSLMLPQILQANAPPAAVVAVQAADNVEIAPIAMKGLTRQPTAVPMDIPIPSRQQEPLYFRTDATEAVFSAELHRHRQWITVGVNSQVTLDPSAPRVEQKFSYSVAYEPTDFFLLEVPRELASKGRLDLSSDDQILAPVMLSDDSGDATKPVRMRVTLPKACIGRCEIAARYSLPPAASGGFHVPLIMPLDAELAGNNLSVVSALDQKVDADSSDWTVIDSGVAEVTSPRTRGFTAVGPTNEVVLKLHGETGDAPVIVQRAWLQTCLPSDPQGGASAVRQDTFAFQFTTRLRQLEISLPSGAACEQATVKLLALNHNGAREDQGSEVPVVPTTTADRVLVVPLPATGEAARYVLSLQYHVPAQHIGRGITKFDLPHIGNGAWVNQLYWQLLLPAEEHLIAAPRGFTSEFLWRWNNFYFGRRPTMDEADLASWVGLAQSTDAYPTTGLNCYLFSTLGQPESCEVPTVGRTEIVFLASALVLLAGLILIYFDVARHPAILLAAVVALAGCAAFYPEVTFLAAQSSVVGLLLVLLAVALRRWLVVDHQTMPADAASSATLALQISPPIEAPVQILPPAASSKPMTMPLSSDAVT
jgi:hypothetical protein